MILSTDFRSEIGTTERGTYVIVLHAPTGKCRAVDPVRRDERVGRVRERLIREIQRELYNEDDVQVTIGCGETGDFLRVIHLPTGKTRTVCPIGKQSVSHLKIEMIDEIVAELVREQGSVG
jgi:hypothetical protein